MTIAERFEAGAVLVQVDSTPDPRDDRALDVRPGAFATFDGERYHSSLAFVYDDRRRRSYARDELPAALTAATEHVRDGGTVRLGNRAAIREVWPTGTIRRVERDLATTARSADGSLVTWTDETPGPDDEAVYDVVVRRDR